MDKKFNINNKQINNFMTKKKKKKKKNLWQNG